MPTSSGFKISRGLVFAAIALLALFLPQSAPLKGQFGCYLDQFEAPEGGGGDCSSQMYDLTFYFNYIYGDYWGDAGQYLVSGACYVYTDCSCNYHNGSQAGYIQSQQEQFDCSAIYFWWTAHNVIEYEYSNCTYGECESTGAQAQEVDYDDDYISYSSVYCDC